MDRRRSEAFARGEINLLQLLGRVNSVKAPKSRARSAPASPVASASGTSVVLICAAAAEQLRRELAGLHPALPTDRDACHRVLAADPELCERVLRLAGPALYWPEGLERRVISEAGRARNELRETADPWEDGDTLESACENVS